MNIVIATIIWSVVIYFMVRKINKTDEFKANPWYYVIWNILFGAIFSLALYLGNMFKFKKQKVPMIISYIVASIFILINILYIFG